MWASWMIAVTMFNVHSKSAAVQVFTSLSPFKEYLSGMFSKILEQKDTSCYILLHWHCCLLFYILERISISYNDLAHTPHL